MWIKRLLVVLLVTLIGTMSSLTVVAQPATPDATPVAASPVVEDPAAQMALYEERTAVIRDGGEPVVEAVLGGDDETVTSLLTPDAAEMIGSVSIADVVDSYTTRQVQMVFAEAGAYFFGQWNESKISGVMSQGGVPLEFTLEADETQDGDLPTGTWTGTISQAQLDISVQFSTDASGNLAAMLDIPAQNVTDVALSEVQYVPERPVGEQVDLRVFAPGAPNDGYTVDFAWGDHLLRIAVGVDVDAELANAVQIIPTILIPPAASGAPESNTTYQVPFGDTWWVFWGGETELHNYHAATPSQRYAYDLVIWKDGATYSGDGVENEDFWAWGQPVLSPANGTVVGVVNDQPDLAPNTSLGDRNAAENPAGNHVVLEVAENEYVFIAHMQQGSVQVQVGDEVQSGDRLGLTGNSGNSSEPHIHIHVQATPDLLDYQASGIPLEFANATVDGELEQDVIPEQGSFIAPE